MRLILHIFIMLFAINSFGQTQSDSIVRTITTTSCFGIGEPTLAEMYIAKNWGFEIVKDYNGNIVFVDSIMQKIGAELKKDPYLRFYAEVNDVERKLQSAFLILRKSKTYKKEKRKLVFDRKPIPVFQYI